MPAIDPCHAEDGDTLVCVEIIPWTIGSRSNRQSIGSYSNKRRVVARDNRLVLFPLGLPRVSISKTQTCLQNCQTKAYQWIYRQITVH